MGNHLIDGKFQSDKYPTTPRGKVPLSVEDPTAQDLLWEYAQRRRTVDAEFADDLETALRTAGHQPDDAISVVVDRCGWCHAAAGGTDEALPTIETSDIKAHTLTCGHNPLVARIAELEAALAEACNHLHSAIQRNRYSCHMCAMDRRDALHESDRVTAHRALIAKGVVLP